MIEKNKKAKRTGKYCSCYQYETRFVRRKHGWERRGRVLVEDVYVIFLFLYFLEKISLILCLNVFGLLADLSQMEDDSIFLARGKIRIFVQKYLCQMEILI